MNISDLANNCKEKKKDCNEKFTPVKIDEEVLSAVSGGDIEFSEGIRRCPICLEIIDERFYPAHIQTKHPEFWRD